MCNEKKKTTFPFYFYIDHLDDIINCPIYKVEKPYLLSSGMKLLRVGFVFFASGAWNMRRRPTKSSTLKEEEGKKKLVLTCA